MILFPNLILQIDQKTNEFYISIVGNNSFISHEDSDSSIRRAISLSDLSMGKGKNN
jgi:hypothetical protein